MDQLNSLAWEITNCSKQAIPLVAMIHFPLKPLHGWLQHTVWWLTSLLAEYAQANLLLVQERFHMAGVNVNLPSWLKNLVPSLPGVLNHLLHGALEKSQVFLVTWSKVDSEAALLDSDLRLKAQIRKLWEIHFFKHLIILPTDPVLSHSSNFRRPKQG